MNNFRWPLWSLIFFSLVLLGGCGSSNNYVATGSGGNANASTGTVVVNFNLLERAVPTLITDFRFLAFDSSGAIVYGPNVVNKAASITLNNVSTETAKFRIEYLQDGVVRGFYEGPLTVPANGIVEINDPPFEDVGSNVVAIEITPISDVMPLGTSRQFVATAILSDGTSTDVTSSATWTSSDEAILQVSNDTGNQGLASALTTGRANLLAEFGEVIGSETVTVSSAVLQSVEVSPIVVVIPIGITQTYTATGIFSDGTTEDLTDQVLWTTSAANVATVDNAGLSTALSAGQTTITATEPNSGLSGESTLTATASVLTRIQVFPSVPVVAAGKKLRFTALGLYSDGQEENLTSLVTWSSSNTAAATISNAALSDGLASTVAEGETTISATFGGVSGQTVLTVEAAELESLEISPLTPDLSPGETQQFAVTGVFTNNTTLDLTASVAYASSDTTVAKISNATGTRGEATALAVGQTTITATDPTSGIQVTTSLQVSEVSLQSIAVTPEDSSLGRGLGQQFVATGTYSDGTTRDLTRRITWNSSDPLIAGISNRRFFRGLATARNLGVATIKAIDPASGVFGTTTLTVTDAALLFITVTPENPSTPAGGLVSFKAVGTFSDSTTRDLTDSVNWTSSDEAVAVIENPSGPTSGQAEGLKIGQTTISAIDSATGIQKATTLTVTAAVLQSIEITPSNPTLPPLDIQNFKASGIYSDGSSVDLTRKVVWRSSKILSFFISNYFPGVGIALLPGQATISASLHSSTLTGETTVNISIR